MGGYSSAPAMGLWLSSAALSRPSVAHLERLLRRRVPINVNGESRQRTVLEAIVLQIINKAMDNDKRAIRLLRRCRTFADKCGRRPLKLIFADNDYTRAFSRA